MTSLFAAVVFYCISGTCNFSYSDKMFPTMAACQASIVKEVQEMSKHAPDMIFKSACLEFKFPYV